MRRDVAFVTLSAKWARAQTNERTNCTRRAQSVNWSQPSVPYNAQSSKRSAAPTRRSLSLPQSPSPSQLLPCYSRTGIARERGERATARESIEHVLLLFQLCSNAVMPTCSFAAGVGLAALSLRTLPFCLCSCCLFGSQTSPKSAAAQQEGGEFATRGPKMVCILLLLYSLCCLHCLPSHLAQSRRWGAN